MINYNKKESHFQSVSHIGNGLEELPWELKTQNIHPKHVSADSKGVLKRLQDVIKSIYKN